MQSDGARTQQRSGVNFQGFQAWALEQSAGTLPALQSRIRDLPSLRPAVAGAHVRPAPVQDSRCSCGRQAEDPRGPGYPRVCRILAGGILHIVWHPAPRHTCFTCNAAYWPTLRTRTGGEGGNGIGRGPRLAKRNNTQKASRLTRREVLRISAGFGNPRQNPTICVAFGQVRVVFGQICMVSNKVLSRIRPALTCFRSTLVGFKRLWLASAYGRLISTEFGLLLTNSG